MRVTAKYNSKTAKPSKLASYSSHRGNAPLPGYALVSFCLLAVSCQTFFAVSGALRVHLLLSLEHAATVVTSFIAYECRVSQIC